MPIPIPELIRALPDEYLARVEAELPGFLTGFYLHGSIALGAFNARHSDIDFVAVISREASEADIAALREVHQAIARKYRRWPANLWN